MLSILWWFYCFLVYVNLLGYALEKNYFNFKKNFKYHFQKYSWSNQIRVYIWIIFLIWSVVYMKIIFLRTFIPYCYCSGDDSAVGWRAGGPSGFSIPPSRPAKGVPSLLLLEFSFSGDEQVEEEMVVAGGL